MSDKANGSDTFVHLTDVQKRNDGESLVVENLQPTMRFEAHFRRRVDLYCAEYPCLQRPGQGQQNMPLGGE